MTRKLLAIVGGILLLIIGFAAGIFSCIYFQAKSYEATILEDATINLMQAEMIMEQFDRGDQEALTTSMNMAIDTEVIRIYQSLESSKDANKINRAKKLLTKVAKHRQAHPPSYTKYPQGNDKEKVIKYVDSILAEYR